MDTHTGDGAARLRIAEDLHSNMTVVAGAGTGKTTALVGRIVALVRTGAVTLGDVAAITFTEAAAAELRERIRRAVDVAAATGDERMVTARAEVDDAAICTLHSFAQRLLVEHCVDAGLAPGFEVLDDTADAADFDERWNRYADTLLDDPDVERALVLGFAAGLRHTDLAAVARALHAHWDRLEDGALEYLHRAPACDGHWPPTDSGPVIDALARARGTLRWCTDDGDNMARHLSGTLTDAGALLTAAGADVAAVFQLLDTLPPFRCAQGRQENWTGHIAEVRAACAEAEQARLDLLEDVRRAVLGDLVVRLATFTLAAAERRRVEGRLTFHDLLVHARRLVRGGGDPMAALRQRYRRLFIDEFQDTDPIQVELAARLVAAVDGTTDMGQARPGALFVVGDPQQSIYRFRRADIEVFDAVSAGIGSTVVLQTNFRSVPGIVDFVNVVFAEIFGAAAGPGQATHHRLLPARHAPTGDGGGTDPGAAPAAGAVQLTFDGIDDAGAASASSAHGTNGRRRPTGPPPVVTVGGALDASTPEVRRRAAGDAAAAISHMVGRGWLVEDTVNGGRRPTRWADVAVLIPARSSLSALEEAFETAGVPYRLEGAALLWGAEEVREVLAVLRATDDPADAVAVLGALRSPGLACGDDDLVTWHEAGGAWDPRTAPLPGSETHPVAQAMAVLDRLHRQRWWSEPSAMVGAAFRELRSFELALAHRRPRDHWQRLRWLQDQARLFDEAPGGTLRDFLTWAALRAAGDGRVGGVGPPDPDDDAVRVMTIHGAKGLEFPVVVLAGLERDQADGPRPPVVLWPQDDVPEIQVGRFRTAGFEQAGLREQRLDILEQHRLLYVGMTRARDHLVVCLHHKRRQGGTDASLAALVTRICAENPSLWRGLPDEHDTPFVPAPGGTVGAPVGTGVLPAHWESERARMLAALRRRPVTTATAVARHGTPHPGALVLPGAVTPDASGRPLLEPEPRELGRRMGQSVHAALADLDPVTGCDAAGRPADEVARARALAHGVADHASEVATMVKRALTNPTVTYGASRRHWREVPVTAPLAHGGVLEGFVDLLFEDHDGLVVVDYKTDHIRDRRALAAAVATYRLQVAAYAAALASSTGLAVSRCVLVFVGGPESSEHVLEGSDLADTLIEVGRVADDLVGT